jgi:hypothetical protein
MTADAAAHRASWSCRLIPLVFAVLLVLSGASQASKWHRLAPTVVAFTTDGERYAAWQESGEGPIMILDTVDWRVSRLNVPGCELANQEWHPALSLPAARGRFLLGCGRPHNDCADGLLDGRSGTLLALPRVDCFGPVWQAVGSHYVVGEDRASKCRQSAHERREGQACLALYNLATGTVTDRPQSQVGDLDQPGAPLVCPALRKRVISAIEHEYRPSAVYKDGVLAEPDAPLPLYRCHGRRTLLAPGGEDTELGGGLLSWDTGSSDYTAAEDALPENTPAHPPGGRLFTYDLSTRRRHSFPLPRVAVPLGPRERPLVGVFGYSNHTAHAVFWIAATKIAYGEAFPTVAGHAVYAAKL